ncbi:hypothetical protein, partial [Hominenteromicrobium sp.]|uniref:hypothetical protein n=1 Tax=Hominenteromicrobium sp. TaxID=3073581 RepID=UPI003A8EF67B
MLYKLFTFSTLCSLCSLVSAFWRCPKIFVLFLLQSGVFRTILNSRNQQMEVDKIEKENICAVQRLAAQ